jgi:putative tricarboxylic transport membrane protein
VTDGHADTNANTNTGTNTDTDAGRDPGTATGTGLRAFLRGRSELGVCALLLAIGVLVLTDALSMDTDFAQRGPVGPRTVPIVVGVALLVVAVLLAVDVLRGGKGEAEGGEDIDLTAPGDWRTVLLLAGVFLANAFLIDPLGFPISGALLFWGSAYALGSRAFHRDPLIAAVLSTVTFFVFDRLLAVPLPGGPLMEVL